MNSTDQIAKDSDRIASDIRRLASINPRTMSPAYRRLERCGTEAIPALVEALKSDNTLLRCRAAVILGKTRDPSVYELLADLTNDSSSDLQYDALIALGYLGDSRAIPLLVSYVKQEDEEHGISSAATTALRDLGSLAVPALMELTSPDNSTGVRWYALRALAGSGDKDASSLIEPFLSDALPEVRIAAIENIGLLNPINATSLLTVCLEDPDARVARAAASELEQLREAN